MVFDLEIPDDVGAIPGVCLRCGGPMRPLLYERTGQALTVFDVRGLPAHVCTDVA